MKKLTIPFAVLYDLLKEGEGKFYSRELYANVEIMVNDGLTETTNSYERDDEKQIIYMFLNKENVMALVMNRNTSFEYEHEDINLSV